MLIHSHIFTQVVKMSDLILDNFSLYIVSTLKSYYNLILLPTQYHIEYHTFVVHMTFLPLLMQSLH